MITKDNSYIFFDAAGTLIYTDPPVFEVYSRIGEEFGISLSPDIISSRFSNAFKEHFRSENSIGYKSSEALEKERWEQVVTDVFLPKEGQCKELFNTLWQYFSKPEHWGVYEDTKDLMYRLHEQNFNIGIASNFDSRLINICKMHFPLIHESNIFYSSDIGYAKPDIRFFQHIIKELNNDKYDFIMIGDDEINDIQAAKKVGWQAIHRDDIRILFEKFKL